MFARALLIYTLPDSKQRFGLSLTGGDSSHADRFSAYRLGGNLPLSSEFPLFIPGYFYQELSARAFVTFSGEYSVPLDDAKHWTLMTYGAVADVEYLPGLSQPGGVNSGAGIGLGYRRDSWQASGQLRLRLRSGSQQRPRRAEHRHPHAVRPGRP